ENRSGTAPRGAAPGTEPLFSGREDIDLRDGPAPDRTAAEWTDPQGGAPTPSADQAAPASGRAATERAEAAAEQPGGRAVVPSRYHRFIRRYFHKLNETAPAEAPATGPSGSGAGPAP